jgi:hypothetical protein
MVRQKDNVSVVKVVTDLDKYYVTMLRLNNTYSGQPRWQATIIRTLYVEKFGEHVGAHVFRFGGHYGNEEQEAEWIVKYFEKKLKHEN